MNRSKAPAEQQALSDHPPAWGAVFSMALCVVVLVASEFMPVSLLTPVAQDLGISQGQAGQAISISGFFAVLTSLLNTPLIRATARHANCWTTTVLRIRNQE